MMFIKYAAFHLQQLGVKKQRERELRNSQDREITQKTEKECKVQILKFQGKLVLFPSFYSKIEILILCLSTNECAELYFCLRVSQMLAFSALA